MIISVVKEHILTTKVITSLLIFPIMIFFLLYINSNEDSLEGDNIGMKNGVEWSLIGSDEDFSSYILGVAGEFEDWSEMADFLKSNGFNSVTTVSNTPNRLYLNAMWNVDKSGEGIPFRENMSALKRWMTRGREYRLQIIYDYGIPISVNAHHLVN